MKKQSKKPLGSLKSQENKSKALDRIATKLINQADYYDKLKEKKITGNFFNLFDDED